MNHTGKVSSQSSDKLLQILESISENRMPIRLQDLAERTGMTQSTVLRYLNALQNSNYVYQEEETYRYALTWKLCRLTENLNSFLSLRNIASPFISQLANTLHLGACLVVNQLNQCMYLDCIDNPRSSGAAPQYIGKRALMHTTGSGKILLTPYSEAQLDEYILNQGLTKLTENTITDRAALSAELEKIRRQGYAIDNEECEIGLTCLSFPLRSYSSAIVAAISVFGNTEDMNPDFLTSDVTPRLKKAAVTISSRLGCVD